MAGRARLLAAHDLPLERLAGRQVDDALVGGDAAGTNRVVEKARARRGRGDLVVDAELRRLRREQLVPRVVVFLRLAWSGAGWVAGDCAAAGACQQKQEKNGERADSSARSIRRSGRRRQYTPPVAEILGLVFSLCCSIFAILPVLTFLRLARLSRELEALADRVARLEQAPSTRGHGTRRPVEPPHSKPPNPSFRRFRQPGQITVVAAVAPAAPAPSAPIAPSAPVAPAPSAPIATQRTRRT